MTITEKVNQVITEAAEANINLKSEVARAMLTEKIMIAIGYHKLEEQNNGQTNWNRKKTRDRTNNYH